MRVTLSPEQLAARDFAARRLMQKERLTQLGGAAGTGKTTLLRAVLDALQLPEFDEEHPGEGGVAVVAPTNKAASVLRSKGLTKATTIHRATSRYLGTNVRAVMQVEEQLEAAQRARDTARVAVLSEELERLLNPSFTAADTDFTFADASILDEASMVDSEMAERLFALEVPILAVGDPFQLPPVSGTCPFLQDFGAADTVVLTKIERQAANSGILDLATAIRSGGHIPTGKIDSHCSVVDLSLPEKYKLWPSASGELIRTADCVITGTNKNRTLFNAKARKIRHGLEPGDLPHTVEPFISYTTDRFAELCKNDSVVLESIAPGRNAETLGAIIRVPSAPKARVNQLNYRSTLYAGHFQELVTQSGTSFPRHARMAERLNGVEIDFAYALTCHRLQGSECGFAVVVEDSYVRRMEDDQRRRWLYTAVTRGKDRVVLLRNSPWH